MGAGLKCFLDFGFFYLYLGQFLAATGQPFFLNAPAKIASTWFREDKVINSYNLESNCYIYLLRIKYLRHNFWIFFAFFLS